MAAARRWTTLSLLAMALATAACGGDDTDDGSGGGGSGGTGTGTGTGTPGCGTLEAPQILTLENVSPPLGAMVPAAGVVHQFTTTNAPGVVTMVTFLFGPAHTAGMPMDAFSFNITDNQDGTYTYQSSAVTWPMAGHVEFGVQEVFAFPNGCYFAFPDPVFSYDVTP